LLLNLPGSFVGVLFIRNNFFQLLGCTLARWTYIPALLKLIAMLDISQTGSHWNEYIWMQYNQFYSFN